MMKSSLALLVCSVSVRGADQPHRIRLGFNFGYMTSSVYYSKALQRVGSDGLFTTARAYEPFAVHGPEHVNQRTLTRTAAALATYTYGNLTLRMDESKKASAQLLLSLSNYPYAIPPDLATDPGKYLSQWPGAPGATTVAAEAAYTNRGPPPAWVNGSVGGYRAAVAELRRLLLATPVNVVWEIGNEPNALGYFWGSAAEYAPLADAAAAALLTTGPETAGGGGDVYCCGFSTDAGAGYENGTHLGFYGFAQTASTRYRNESAGGNGAKTGLSWHFYRHRSNDANPNVTTYVRLVWGVVYLC